MNLYFLIIIKKMGCFLNHKKNLNIEDDPKRVKFLCPECGIISPEISNINIEKKYVEFTCKICAEKIYYSKFFYKNIENGNLLYSCKPKPLQNEQAQFLFEEYNIMPGQSEEIKKSSLEDIDKKELKELNKYKEAIKLKNEQLKKIIQLNNLIIEASEQSQYNYFHLKSLKNISKKLKNEKLRDANDLKFLLTTFKYENKNAKDAIKKIDKYLGKNKNIEEHVESLFLSESNLNDEYINYISKIKFNQLKEINLSGNEIINIEPLCNMNLPFLEFLNLSNNQIVNIKPLEEINSKKFKYLFIQNNQIKDIQVFLGDAFPTFEILRIDSNKIGISDSNTNSDSKTSLINLYKLKGKILILNIDDINKYNIDYRDNKKEIKVANEEKGDLVLKYIFINIPSNNIIKKLELINNKIEDPSILNRIQFDFLEELNLQYNNIKNLNFLKGMKAKNLKVLHLEKNDFEDLSILYNIKEIFNQLKKIYLDKNKFDDNEPKFKNLKDNLENQGIELELNSLK